MLRVRHSVTLVGCCWLALAGAAGWPIEPVRGADAASSPPSLVWSVEDLVGGGAQSSTLVIGTVDGSPKRFLGEGRKPKISPDGRRVAYVDDDDTYVLPSTGGRPWLVARGVEPVAWSRDSRHLVSLEQRRALHVTDVVTRRTVTVDRAATIFGVSVSPSGDELVWGRGRPGLVRPLDGGVDLYRARLDGSGRIRLTTGGRSSYPVWGRERIAFSRVRSSGNPVFPIYELWTITPTGRGVRRVTRESYIPVGWSDSRRLLAMTVTKAGVVLSLSDVRTGRARPLVRGQQILPLAVAKDGQSFLVWALSPTRKPEGDLVRVLLNGRRTTLVRDADESADWNL